MPSQVLGRGLLRRTVRLRSLILASWPHLGMGLGCRLLGGLGSVGVYGSEVQALRLWGRGFVDKELLFDVGGFRH